MNWNSLQHQLGLLRSYALYYGKPFHRRRLVRFYQEFIQEGEVCFDIGAHLGSRMDAWLAMNAQVVAVEPQPLFVKFLERNFGKNPNVTILPKAVGAHSGTADLHVSRKTPTISTLSGKEWQQMMKEKSSFNVSWDYTIEVEVITLDQLIGTYGIPAFCKIDVEDFELEVLRGLSQPIPALSFEYFSDTVPQALACIQRLEEITTFEYNWSFGESQAWPSDRWLSAAEISNIFSQFTPDDRSGDVYARWQP